MPRLRSVNLVSGNHYRLGGPARGAFTLVELLVVIGIIALLVSILLPTLSRAREASNVVKCISNLRTIGEGLMQYVNDNKGMCPGPSLRGQSPNYNQGSANTARYLAIYLGHETPTATTEVNLLYICPTAAGIVDPTTNVMYCLVDKLPDGSSCFGYPAVAASNGPPPVAAAAQKPTHKITDMPNASQEAVMGDVDWQDSSAGWDHPGQPVHGMAGPNLAWRCYLYFDGHAAKTMGAPNTMPSMP